MRRCSNGHEVANSGFQFCPICGERLEEKPAAPDPPRDDVMFASSPPIPGQGGDPASDGSDAVSEAGPRRRTWPVSIGWTVVVAIFTAFTGLFVLLAIYLWRGGHKGASAFVAAIVLLFVVAVIAGASGGTHPSTTSAAEDVSTTAHTTPTSAPRSCASYKGAKPQSCISRMGFACSGYSGAAKPNDCFTATQLRARAAARVVQARAAAVRRKAAIAAAKVHAAEVAAANAWQGRTLTSTLDYVSTDPPAALPSA